MAATRGISLVGLTFLALVLVGCEGEPAQYFRNRVNRATQDAVVRRFGPPHRVHALRNGDMVWSYEFGSGSACAVHILRFDPEHVLRDWHERHC
jgi:hypothetical protein